MPSKESLKSVTTTVPSFFWKAHNLTVVGDGYLEDGTRIHLVKEPLDTEPKLLSNALVISEHWLYILLSGLP